MFGALGKAFGVMKKPLQPINKAVGKVPGMQTLGKPFGMAQPNQGQGVGPSNPMLSKFGMLGQKMGQPPAQVPEPSTNVSLPPPPMTQPSMDESVTPDVMPSSGESAPTQGTPFGQGVGPSPRVMGGLGIRRPQMQPQPQMMGRVLRRGGPQY